MRPILEIVGPQGSNNGERAGKAAVTLGWPPPVKDIPVTRRSSRSTRSLLATIAASAIVLAACGSSDDEAGSTTTPAATESQTADAATAPTTEATTATTEAAPAESSASSDEMTADTDEDEDEIIVSDISDMPQECVDLLVETLQLIEPTVSAIDWETATMTDFQSLSDDFETELSSLDDRTSAAGCDQYDFTSDEESLAAAIELAEREAPGTVGWLEFIGQLTMDVSSDASAAPQDCESAIAIIDALIAEGKTMMSIPLGDMTGASNALTAISTECTAEQSAAFFAREDVTAFLQS